MRNLSTGAGAGMDKCVGRVDKRVGKEEALDWEKERKERENQAARAVAAKGRSNSNSISNNNAHSKVRSDGKEKDRERVSDKDEMDVRARDKQRSDGLKVSTSTVGLEAGVGVQRGRVTDREDMKNGRDGGRGQQCVGGGSLGWMG